MLWSLIVKQCLILIVSINLLPVILCELVLCILEVSLKLFLSALGECNLSLSVFSLLLCICLTASDILLASLDCKLEPPEHLSESEVVGIHFLSYYSLDVALQEVNCLIARIVVFPLP